MKVLFLDIDGVLNDHSVAATRGISQYCGIQGDKVALLNQVTDKTGCKLVLSTAWRYMIHNEAMTLRGFEYMLITHGLSGDIIGLTREDRNDGDDRGSQIMDWLIANGNDIGANEYVILDDLDLNLSKFGSKFVQTNGDRGLTQEDVDKLVEILNEFVA